MSQTDASLSTSEVPESPRILLTRLSAVGDCIHTMPLVGALRRKFPTAFIAWATQPGPATLLAGYPGLDEVIVVPRNWLKSLSHVKQIRRTLLERGFDITVDPQSLTKSALLAWLTGARIRIGFAKPQGRELSLWLNSLRVAPTADHVVDRYLQTIGPLIGVAQPNACFELPRYERSAVDAMLAESPVGSEFAVINPGAGWDSKLWLPDRFAQVAKHLGEQHRLRSVVVWAGQREQDWADQIVAKSAGYAWKSPDSSLPELAEIMRSARLCVAADTGPLHLAAAVGTPCVALFGPTKPSVCGPYGPLHQCVQAYYQGGSGRRQADNDAMRAIDASSVVQACDELLARLPQPHAA